MFKFNFNVSEEIKDKDVEILKESTSSDKLLNQEQKCYDSEEIRISEEVKNKTDAYKQNCFKSIVNDNFVINYITSAHFKNIQNNSMTDIAEAELNHSDLIPGIYEGGAKLWECTEDLLLYLSENTDEEFFKNKSVLDLGCGIGLLGIFALMQGAKRVWFQDYNKDVLETITIPNVLLNDNEVNKKCKFYSGDWKKFTECTTNSEKFDFILTSETIYDSKNHEKLLETFKNKLNPNGTVYLAAKTYYFGVGGGLRQFEELISNDTVFQYQPVWNSNGGLCREILKIQKSPGRS